MSGCISFRGCGGGVSFSPVVVLGVEESVTVAVEQVEVSVSVVHGVVVLVSAVVLVVDVSVTFQW